MGVVKEGGLNGAVQRAPSPLTMDLRNLKGKKTNQFKCPSDGESEHLRSVISERNQVGQGESGHRVARTAVRRKKV